MARITYPSHFNVWPPGKPLPIKVFPADILSILIISRVKKHILEIIILVASGDDYRIFIDEQDIEIIHQ